MFNPNPVFQTAAGWVRQLDDGTILGPVATKQLAEKLEKVEEVVKTDAQPAKAEKKSSAQTQK